MELVKKYIEGQQRGEESLQVPLVSEHKAQIREEDQHLHSQVLQDVLLRLDKAFKAFFRRVKNGENPGYPPLQGRNRYARFTYAQGGYWVDVHEKRAPLTLCKIGTLTITLHRKIEGALKTCTVKHEAGQWYAVFSCEVEEGEPLPEVDSEIGIDLGLTHFAALSQGTFIQSPRHDRKAQADLKRKQQAVSRKKRGSHRREKAGKQVQRPIASLPTSDQTASTSKPRTWSKSIRCSSSRTCNSPTWSLVDQPTKMRMQPTFPTEPL